MIIEQKNYFIEAKERSGGLRSSEPPLTCRRADRSLHEDREPGLRALGHWPALCLHRIIPVAFRWRDRRLTIQDRVLGRTLL